MSRIIFLLIPLLIPLAAQAQQEDSILTHAMRLATEGQGEAARSYVRQQLDRIAPADSRYAEALFAAGVVAATTDDARMFFRRVSIEFSRSSWADEALLRLAQLAYAEQDYESALRAAERIVMDYPFSNVFAEANYWAGRANLEQGNAAIGCAQLNRAGEVAGENIELANRVRFYRMRCATAAGAPSTGPDAPPRTGRSAWTVQVAALQSAAAADELMRALHAEGYEDVRVVQEEGFLKVRVGQFTNRAQATRLAGELSRKFGGNPFVVEQP